MFRSILAVALASLLTPALPLGVQVNKDDITGHIVILSVVQDSPAEKAGLKKDDAILKLDGADVGALEAFVESIRNKKSGDKIKLTIQRAGKEQDIEVTLD